MITQQLYRYSAEKKSKVAAEVLATLNAYKLAELGARTHTIISLTRLSERKAKDVIRDVTGKSSTPGRIVTSLQGFIKSRHHRLQASVLINAFTKAKGLGLSDTEALIQSYTSYREHFPDAEGTRNFIDIDQANLLSRAVSVLKSFSLTECQHCQCKILRDVTEMFTQDDCPICHASAQSLNSTEFDQDITYQYAAG